MTRPDPLREMARVVHKMPCHWISCDGDDCPTFKEILRQFRTARDDGYRQGQESMRERAAKVADGFNTEYFMMRIHLEHGPVNETIAEAIRALDPETEVKP